MYHRNKLISTLALGLMGSALVHAATLPEAVLSGLVENPELGVVLNQLRAQESALSIAKGGYLPTLNLNAGYGRENTDSPGTRTLYDDHDKGLTRGELSVTLSQLIFDGFRTSEDISRSRAERDANRFEVNATASDLALEITEVYLGVLNAERTLSLAEENLSSHREIHDKIQKRTDQGVGSASELSQIDGRLARAASNKVAAENNLYDARATYLRRVGDAPDALTYADVTADVTADLLPQTQAEAEAYALANHPRLLAAQQDLEAAKSQISQAESNYYPEVYLELRSGWTDNVDGVEGHNNDNAAMVRFDYNLFNGGRDRHKVSQAAGQRGEAADILRSASRQVTEGLALSWNAYQSLERQERFLQQHVDASRATMIAYRKQFELGQRSLMDLLDTENELFEARRDRLVAERDGNIAEYRVLNATGTLLSAFKVELPES
ncbi:MAG: adhesin transport system outer membrane protein [Motiliproteus sp.]|jgi:adhesin transport system outer membrane protein